MKEYAFEEKEEVSWFSLALESSEKQVLFLS